MIAVTTLEAPDYRNYMACWTKLGCRRVILLSVMVLDILLIASDLVVLLDSSFNQIFMEVHLVIVNQV